jgi:MFS family permease
MQAKKLQFPPPRPPNTSERRKELRGDVRTSLTEGLFYSLMVGVGETYIPAFVIAVGLGEVTSGLIATLPLLAGSLFQLLSPTMVGFFKSYRRWALICATVQCVSFLPLALASLFGYMPASAAFLIAAIYQGTSLSISACWNSWVGSLIPCSVRTNFFARRARLTQIGAMVGFLLGGLILHLHEGKATWQFAAVFLLAFACRAISVSCLSNLTDVEAPPLPKVVPLGAVLKCFRKDAPAGQFLIYLLCMQMAVQVSSPFVTPYLLRGIKLDYWHFALLTAAPYLVKSICFPWFGKHARRDGGSHSLLVFGGIGIVVGPILWLFSNNFIYLMTIQCINGFFWAAYELAGMLLILAKIPERERISVLTKYNVANALAMTLGSLFGASLLDSMGKSIAAYYTLFVISTVARGATIVLLKKLVIDQPKLLLFPLPRLSFSEFDGYIAPIQAWIRIFKFKKPRLKAVSKSKSKKAA